MHAQESEKFGWFWKIVESVLRSHAKNTNLNFFLLKYPGVPTEIIADRRIKSAAKFAGLVGFASGIVVSIASLTAVTSAISTVATGFAGSPITVPVLAISLPVMGLALTGEIGLLIRIQLNLAYDLFILNNLPVDVDDPEQMQEITKVAFGIKGVELTGQALQKIIPQIAPQLLRKAMRTGLVRRKFQEMIARRLTWAFARKYLAEGVLIKALVPGIAVFTATWWDYTSTISIGKTLQGKIRRRGLAVKEIDNLDLYHFNNPELVLKSVLLLGLPGSYYSETELTFYSNLVNVFRESYGNEVVDSLKENAFLEWDDVANELVTIDDPQQQNAIFKLLLTMGFVGGKLNRQKRRRLKHLAKHFNIPFDKKNIELKCNRYIEPKPFRTCLLVVIFLFMILVGSCIFSTFGIYWLTSQ